MGKGCCEGRVFMVAAIALGAVLFALSLEFLPKTRSRKVVQMLASNSLEKQQSINKVNDPVQNYGPSKERGEKKIEEVEISQIVSKSSNKSEKILKNMDEECAEWNCTCQGLSDVYLINHRLKSYGISPKSTHQWWRKHKCKTSPKPITSRSPIPKRSPTEPRLAPSGNVCYFVPTRPGDGRKEVILETWGKKIRNTSLYFVLSIENSTESYVDHEAKEIHVAYRDYVDSTGRMVPEYQPENLPGWQSPLVAKIMKFWEYMGSIFEKEFAHRCAWFIKTDDDTWMNEALLKKRLACLDPEEDTNVGYSCGFGIGVFTGYSRAIVRQFAYFIQTLRKETHDAHWFIGDIEDRRIGQLLMRFGIDIKPSVRRNATDRPDYVNYHPDSTTDEKVEFLSQNYSPIQIGCMSFSHQARPPVMRWLTERLDSALELTKGDVCLEWRRQGLVQSLRDEISLRCPE